MGSTSNGGVDINRVHVTPEVAQEWLERNAPRQRLISPAHQRSLADEMRRDRWQEPVAPIQLARNGGWVQDGRHRLGAVVETGRAQWFWVATDCDPDTFDVIDAVKPRSAANVLEADGVKNSKGLEAVGRLLHSWLRGAAEFSGQPPRSRILDLARTYGHDLQPLFPIGEKASKQTVVHLAGGRTANPMPKSMATFCAFLEQGTDSLIARLADYDDEDINNHEADAVSLLRDGVKKRSAAGRRISKRAVVSLFVIAKNLDHTGAQLPAKGLVYKSAAEFPMPEWPVKVTWGADHKDDDEDD